MPKTLYIIGNGFDLIHEMRTQYSDYRNWLLESGRFDLVYELENAFGDNPDHSDMWSNFETSLGQYDFEKAATWDLPSLYLFQMVRDDKLITFDEPFILDVSPYDIVNNSFLSWVRSIKLRHEKKINLYQDSLFLTFNYTETLESLYEIQSDRIVHIHGCRMHGEKLIVGHRNYVDPTASWKENGYMRENNERVQHICDMNKLYKPIEKIIGSHQDFWDQLHLIEKVVVIGHSCNEIDYLYFEKVTASIPRSAEWIFYYHNDDDRNRIQKMAQKLNLINYATYPNSTLTESGFSD